MASTPGSHPVAADFHKTPVRSTKPVESPDSVFLSDKPLQMDLEKTPPKMAESFSTPITSARHKLPPTAPTPPS